MELGEIEHALMQCRMIEKAAVVMRNTIRGKKSGNDNNGDQNKVCIKKQHTR